jgi:FkbM family methyltransferase
MPRILSSVKQLAVPQGRTPREIRSGAFRGLRMDLDLSSQTQLYFGAFEREVSGWLERLSRDICAAVDVGACEGEYTLYFLAKTPARRVISFEPDPGMLARLMGNLDLNRLGNDPRLTLLSSYVGARDSDSERTLDSLLSSFSTPCLIKVDVEGAEAGVLEGARRLLQSDHVRWIIETHSRALEEQCVRTLRDAGYTTRIIPTAWWRVFLPELRVSETVQFNRWLAAARDGTV